MNTHDKISIIGLIVICLTVTTFFVGMKIGINAYRLQAIERGFAEYNSTNGIWQWKK